MMNEAERIATSHRIVDYLAKRLAIARLWNEQTQDEESRFQIADPEKLLKAFLIDPMMIGELDADETHAANLRYLDNLSPAKKLVLCWYIEMEAVRYLDEFKRV